MNDNAQELLEYLQTTNTPTAPRTETDSDTMPEQTESANLIDGDAIKQAVKVQALILRDRPVTGVLAQPLDEIKDETDLMVRLLKYWRVKRLIEYMIITVGYADMKIDPREEHKLVFRQSCCGNFCAEFTINIRTGEAHITGGDQPYKQEAIQEAWDSAKHDGSHFDQWEQAELDREKRNPTYENQIVLRAGKKHRERYYNALESHGYTTNRSE